MHCPGLSATFLTLRWEKLHTSNVHLWKAYCSPKHLFSSLCLIYSVFHSHKLWGIPVFLNQPRIPALVGHFHVPAGVLSLLRFSLFSYPSYVFDLSFSTAISCVYRVFFRILVSLESLLCQFTPANACQQRLELGGDRTKPSPSDGFSDLLAGERLGFPTLGGSIYRESLRDFTRKD